MNAGDDLDLLRERVERALGSIYEVEAEVGRGGMAVVYRARERVTGRMVALKVLRSDQMRDPETIARFEREAMVTLRLRHPFIVQTYTVHSLAPRGMALALEFMGGGTVKDQLKQCGPLAPEVATRIVGDVALALSHAHSLGVIHRDLKPDNIFLDPEQSAAKVGDFGIAHAGTGDHLTVDGTTIGTPAYMSPEQLEGRADARSDVYSLGLVAWEMLTGKSPWSGEALWRMIERQRKDSLPAIGTFRRDVPRSLLAVVERCLEKVPERRFQSMDELARALGRVDESPREATESLATRPATPSGQSTIRLPTQVEPPIPVRERWPGATPSEVEGVTLSEAASEAHRVDVRVERAAKSVRVWAPGAVVVGTLALLVSLLWLGVGDDRGVRPEAPAADSAAPISKPLAPAPQVVPPAVTAPVPIPPREEPVVAAGPQVTESSDQPTPDVLRQVEQLLDEGNYVEAAQLASRRMTAAAYRATRPRIVRACEAENAVLSGSGAPTNNCASIP